KRWRNVAFVGRLGFFSFPKYRSCFLVEIISFSITEHIKISPFFIASFIGNEKIYILSHLYKNFRILDQSSIILISWGFFNFDFIFHSVVPHRHAGFYNLVSLIYISRDKGWIGI